MFTIYDTGYGHRITLTGVYAGYVSVVALLSAGFIAILLHNTFNCARPGILLFIRCCHLIIRRVKL